MDNLRQETTNAYDNSAKLFVEKFQNLGARIKDIDLAFKLAGNPEHARVLEIGCGDGRDAKEIVRRAEWYCGFDISAGLLTYARAHVPEAQFEQADAASYNFPEQLDIVFAFASLLHLNKEETKAVLDRIHTALKPHGVAYLSLKYSQEYTEKVQDDQFGRRQFFLYNPEIIESLAGDGYKTVATTNEMRGDTEWFEIALQKR